MGARRPKKAQKRINVHSLSTRKSGIAGLFELALRRFKVVTHAATLLPIYIMGSVCLGLALSPAVLFLYWFWGLVAPVPLIWQIPLIGFSFAVSYFIYGFTVILVIPAANFLLQARAVPFRGQYYSFEALRWYVHNGLTYAARYTFLEFITPTPFNLMFYRLMGMKMGKGCVVNSSHISDPSLIILGNYVTIGGSATVVAHYGMAGFLVIAPTVIKDYANIGLKAIIMGGVEIGEGATVMPASVVMPKTVIPPGEVWGGVPAKKISGPGRRAKKIGRRNKRAA